MFSVHYKMHLGCCIYLSLPTPPSRPSWKLEIESDCKIPCCLIKTHRIISYWSDNVKWLIDWSACNTGILKRASGNYAKVVEDWFLLSIGICISQVRGTRKGSVNIGVYEGNSRGIGECVWSYSDTFISRFFILHTGVVHKAILEVIKTFFFMVTLTVSVDPTPYGQLCVNFFCMRLKFDFDDWCGMRRT